MNQTLKRKKILRQIPLKNNFNNGGPLPPFLFGGFMRLLFDVETDGLLNVLTTIHCLEIIDIDTGLFYSCTDNDPNYRSIEKGLDLLMEAKELIGHNIISFDIPAIQKIYPLWQPKGMLTDTLNISRLIYTNLVNLDCTRYRQKIQIKKKLTGTHSLEAWGVRLGIWKGDFGKTTDWKHWSEEMQSYCKLDVKVNLAMYKYFMKEKYSDRAIRLECDFQVIMARQERLGIPFDVEGAEKLLATLKPDIDTYRQKINETVSPWRDNTIFIPKVNNKTRGYVKGVPVTKVKVTPFNPNSRPQIIRLFKEKYNWEPTEFTKKGNPSIGADVLSKLSFPEAQVLAPFLEANKLLSQLSTGKKAWLKCVTADGLIHGYVCVNGARTGRASHNSPNLGQVPRVGNFRGKECRSLFGAPEGMVMVGCDASGLELRNLAHYLYVYDHGLYIDVILKEDIHVKNQTDAALPTRDTAKTFIYAFNYGAGDTKLGSITHPDAPSGTQKRIGASLREKFLKNNRALSKLLIQVKHIHRTRGYFKGLDGRHLLSISEHSALNTLLQGAGAVIMKEATVLTWKYITEAGLYEKVYPALNIHDENQVFTYPEYAEQVGTIMVQAIKDAGVSFDFRCPLDGEYKIGKNWAETH